MESPLNNDSEETLGEKLAFELTDAVNRVMLAEENIPLWVGEDKPGDVGVNAVMAAMAGVMVAFLDAQFKETPIAPEFRKMLKKNWSRFFEAVLESKGLQ